MSQKKSALLAAIMAACFCFGTGCQKTEPVPELPAFQEENSAAALSDEFVEDYQYVWTMLEENFPLMGVLERTCGDLEEFKNNWQEKVEQCDKYSEFYDTMAEFSASMKNVGHLYFISKEKFPYFRDTYHSALPEQFPLAPEFLKIFDDEEVLKTYHQVGAVPPEPSRQPSSEYAEPISVEYPAEGTMLIHIPDFKYDQSNNEALLAAYTEAEQKGVQNLILDLTENGGGNEQVWIEYIVQPNISEPVSYSKYNLLPLTEYNRSFWEPAGMLEDIKPIDELPEFPNLSQEDIRLCDYFVERTKTLPPSQDFPLFSGEIYVLIDSTVFSASEGFAYFCKETGFATLVGETTGGDGVSFGDPLYFELPNTHYVFRYTASYGLNSDGSCNAEKGTEPDVPCEGGETPLDACMRIIRES